MISRGKGTTRIKSIIISWKVGTKDQENKIILFGLDSNVRYSNQERKKRREKSENESIYAN